jgi:hypothetical protein
VTRLFTARRVVLSLLAVGALALIGIGFSMTEEPDPSAKIYDSAVRQVFPSGGELDLRQSDIGFQLAPEYTGRLQIDGVDIPDDQVRFQIGLNIWMYRPGPETETGALRPGRHTATAIFWLKGTSEADGRSYSWTFNVH